MAIASFDQERLSHINSKMKIINDSCDTIYESWIDRDFEELNSSLDTAIAELQDLKSSVEDN